MKFKSVLISLLLCVSTLAYSAVNRPKVGLVLSGGGAKGMSHVGVIKYLHEIGIPVDYVVGTSMGSIVGAMYSLGYSDEQMQEIVSNVDWSYYLMDGVERQVMSYQFKQIDDRYDYSLPFGQKEIQTKEHIRSLRKDSDDGEILSSLMPSGVITGNNILTLFNNLCIGYTEPMDFDDLPIPFACVSTNIVDGTAKVFRSGALPVAIRSSMAIPGVFSPVFTDTEVLVDGGIRNNFPVNIAKEMGADIVIGVNLAIEKERDPEKLRPVISQIRQLIKIFTGNRLTENNSLCDILITPDMSAFGSLEFNRKSIEKIIKVGYDEAVKHEKELRELHDLLAEYGSTEQQYNAPKAQTLLGNSFVLSGFTFEGIDEDDAAWLISKSNLLVGEEIDVETLNKVTSTFYGTGAYSEVLYSISKEPESSGCVVHFTLKQEKPHLLSSSIRVDSRDAVQVGLRMAINQNRLAGFKAEAAVKVSSNPSFLLSGSYMGRDLPRFTFDYGCRIRSASMHINGSLIDSFRYTDHQVRLSVSEYMLSNWHFKAGPQFNSVHYNNALSSYYLIEMDQSISTKNCLGLFAEAYYDNLSEPFYPDRGLRSSLRIDQNLYHFKKSGPQFKPFIRFNYAMSAYIPVSDRFVVNPQIYLALLFDSQCRWGSESVPASYSDDLALCYYPDYKNKFGGAVADYDFYGQLPFAGVYDVEESSQVAVLRTDLRYNVFSNTYLTLKLNYARAADSALFFTNSITDQFGNTYVFHNLDKLGAAIEYAVNTKVGPLSLEVGWNNINHRVGVFFNFGKFF